MSFSYYFSTHNSFDQETTSTSPGTSIPKHNNHYFRDSSADSSDSGDELSTTPTTPTTPMSPNSDTLTNSTPNMQRRASESITEAIQFKKLPMTRRYTLPSRINPFGATSGGTENNNLSRSPLVARFWGTGGRDSSVQVAMENVQFGL